VNAVTIAGVGLIGGSFALALRKAGFAGRIIGVSSPATIEKALAREVIDEALSLELAVAASDLVYLAQPIQRIIEMLPGVDAAARPGTLITDAGSTKRAIAEAAASSIRRGRFIGGHPMAGKESRGVEEADADLFRGRPYVLTSREPELERWIERIGARLVILDPIEHDRLAAVVSHLPQLISTALAPVIGEEPRAASIAGPAALDFTRLAFSPYDVWADILATNAGPIDAALGVFISRLEELRTTLQSPDTARAFHRAASAARELRRASLSHQA